MQHNAFGGIMTRKRPRSDSGASSSSAPPTHKRPSLALAITTSIDQLSKINHGTSHFNKELSKFKNLLQNLEQQADSISIDEFINILGRFTPSIKYHHITHEDIIPFIKYQAAWLNNSDELSYSTSDKVLSLLYEFARIKICLPNELTDKLFNKLDIAIYDKELSVEQITKLLWSIVTLRVDSKESEKIIYHIQYEIAKNDTSYFYHPNTNIKGKLVWSLAAMEVGMIEPLKNSFQAFFNSPSNHISPSIQTFCYQMFKIKFEEELYSATRFKTYQKALKSEYQSNPTSSLLHLEFHKTLEEEFNLQGIDTKNIFKTEYWVEEISNFVDSAITNVFHSECGFINILIQVDGPSHYIYALDENDQVYLVENISTFNNSRLIEEASFPGNILVRLNYSELQQYDSIELFNYTIEKAIERFVHPRMILPKEICENEIDLSPPNSFNIEISGEVE